MNDNEGTVLIVEDEPGLADLFGEYLSDEYAVRIAYDLSEARSKLDEAIDVILLDRRLPDGQGDELLDTIDERGLSPAVAMVTAVDPDFDIVDKQIDTYLVKPAEREDIREVIESLLQRREYATDLQELLALISKQVALEAEKDYTTLEDSAVYENLLERIDSLSNDLSDDLSSMDPDELRSVLRSIDLSLAELDLLLDLKEESSSENARRSTDGE